MYTLWVQQDITDDDLGTPWALPGREQLKDDLGTTFPNFARLADTFGKFWHCLGIALLRHMMNRV